MFPAVQATAREELDLVLGTGRLPNIEDLASLPYIQAIYMEALRWAPVLPLGVPHRSISADEYEGYYIPAGTTVIGVRLSHICLAPSAESLPCCRMSGKMVLVPIGQSVSEIYFD